MRAGQVTAAAGRFAADACRDSAEGRHDRPLRRRGGAGGGGGSGGSRWKWGVGASFLLSQVTYIGYSAWVLRSWDVGVAGGGGGATGAMTDVGRGTAAGEGAHRDGRPSTGVHSLFQGGRHLGASSSSSQSLGRGPMRTAGGSAAATSITTTTTIHRTGAGAGPDDRTVAGGGRRTGHSTHDAPPGGSDDHVSSGFSGLAVMAELAARVLSRHITSSDVLVVAPGAVLAGWDATTPTATASAAAVTRPRPPPASWLSGPDGDAETVPRSAVGEGFLLIGAAEGHAIHAMDLGGNLGGEPTLDEWWDSFRARTDGARGDGGDIAGNEWWWSWSSSTSGGPSQTVQRPAWILLAVFDAPFGMEDAPWTEAGRFLDGCTVTYIVMAVHSARQTDGSYQYGGLLAAESLLARRYKLQTLSVSHYHADAANAGRVRERFGPNALLQSTDQVRAFLEWGADAAGRYGPDRREDVFSAYLFATQGLDLAIPAADAYLREGAAGGIDASRHTYPRPLPFKTCPYAQDEERLELRFEKNSLRLNRPTQSTRHFTDATVDDALPRSVHSLWMDGNTAATSEAACVKTMDGPSQCITRVLEADESTANDVDGRPNILLILLDPMSRSHFRRVMPKTADALHDGEFIEFTKYTAVGPNSGPNQAALYSGVPLSRRDGIDRNLNGEEWLWDRLRASGYVTLKAEDGCIENSNMIQSLKPNTTHGGSLQGLFCFDAFSRPNCIGPDLASTLLFNYGEQFVTAYEKRRQETNPLLRWAAFLHLVDSHEDTMILAASVDQGLSEFIRRIKAMGCFNDTLLILTSDHGLHYGPFFQSEVGRREATEPLLHIRIPDTVRKTLDMNVLRENSNVWTTPFDLHETLLDLTRTSERGSKTRRRGRSLTKPLPDSRKLCSGSDALIPSKYCDLQVADAPGIVAMSNSFHSPMVNSFFLDIPRHHRPTLKLDDDCPDSKYTATAVKSIELCDT